MKKPALLSEKIESSLFELTLDCLMYDLVNDRALKATYDLKMATGLLLTAMRRGMYSVVEEQLAKIYDALNTEEDEDA